MHLPNVERSAGFPRRKYIYIFLMFLCAWRDSFSQHDFPDSADSTHSTAAKKFFVLCVHNAQQPSSTLVRMMRAVMSAHFK